jgi:hypothetical protein
MPMTTEEYAKRIVDLVKAAVDAEREQCAKEAEEWGEEHDGSVVWGPKSSSEAIADVIRHQLPQ